MKKALYTLVLLISCILLLAGCSNSRNSEKNIENILADATILYCTEPDGTILFSSEEASSANITIPNDAILYLSMDGYDSTHGVWDMQKNDWVLGPKEAGFMFYKTDDQILSFDFGDGEYTTYFELITDEERQRNYELLYQDAQHNDSEQSGDAD